MRVEPTGKRIYAVFYRAGRGKNAPKRTLTIGEHGVLTPAEARQQAKEALAAAARGADPHQEQRSATARRSAADRRFKIVAQDYIARRVRGRQRTAAETERLIERELMPEWAALPLDDFTPRLIRARVRAIADGEARPKAAPQLANRVLQVAIKPLFRWAVESDLLEVDPAAPVKLPAEHVRRERALSDAELRLVWRAAGALPMPWPALVRFLILTGARRSEAGGMRWPELGPGLATWLLPAERSKNGRPLLLPLPPAARALLAPLPRLTTGFVFAGRGGAAVGDWSKVKAKLDAAVEAERAKAAKAGQPIPAPANWRWHDLRRSAATGMARIGVAPHIIEAVLNHVSGHKAGVAGIYNVHSYETEKAEALEAWAAHLVRIAGPASAKPRSRRRA